ncbi:MULTISPECIES: HAD-IA family hydrolase [Kitasatospora]|uniref:Sugar-phosphatase n=1 Tax=Kitasatospora cineracea TaxID=88074 RepID=A0A3N4RHL2_9ACTN|nr:MULTISPECIES: HAD-IA family hydrolase [Kitasatospora]RPE32833.1 sugar-phosphatase [Kitasatospora cineracea]WAL73676.1 HAD-IA family hydrolase [Kitasatospora sp. YST-16]WNW39734.1 HAD-IA family hydrolase [Streptomyces sp. Li-HN-5-13]
MPVLTPPVRAVLLDMDGTLVNSDAVVERCWRRWAERNGLDGDEVMRVAHGRQGHLTMGLLLPDRPVEQNLAENAVMLDEESSDIDGVVEVPGAARLVASLAGLPHALVTSADDRLARVRMAAAGVPLPPLVITAEHVGASKPDPEGFLKAAAELGVAPAECLVLEDSEAGIAAARAAGMPVLGIGPRAAAHRPDHHVDDLSGVRVSGAADGGLVVELP